MKLFVDTNILLDYLDERLGFDAAARKLMVLGFLHEFEALDEFVSGDRFVLHPQQRGDALEG